jgi:hypothetical protein
VTSGQDNVSSFSEVDLLLFSPKSLAFPSVFPSPEIFNKNYFIKNNLSLAFCSISWLKYLFKAVLNVLINILT